MKKAKRQRKSRRRIISLHEARKEMSQRRDWMKPMLDLAETGNETFDRYSQAD
jgi:hypothetical protein